jgi:cation-transporting ATPase E
LNNKTYADIPKRLNFRRLSPQVDTGLSSGEVLVRTESGAVNTMPRDMTPSTGRIIRRNIFTLFNLINLILAIAVLLVGHIENTLFFGVVICNTILGVFQELRAKRTLDKLSILSRSQALVVRDGRQVHLDIEEIVLDDIVILNAGDQISVDSAVLTSEGLEVNESLLTGEANNIRKEAGDSVMSGSYVTAGRGCVQVMAVGEDNYATALTQEAKKEKKPKTQLMRTLDIIIKVLTVAIIPTGLLLFYNQYKTAADLAESVLGATAAVIGMIPEGLVILTSVTLTVGAVRLARRKALVQTLGSIETLARVDVLCLDKTGTITDGTLSFEKLILWDDASEQLTKEAIAGLMKALPDENATAVTLRSQFKNYGQWNAVCTVPFSSLRKWSGATFMMKGSYILGAPGIVLGHSDAEVDEVVQKYAEQGFRVLCLACTQAPIQGSSLPEGLRPAALLVLSDTIRPEAQDTFRFFAGEGVTLKVISGDDAVTVSTIAGKAGISGSESYVDMSAAGENPDFASLAEKYTVFGRVTPQQKRELIRALQNAGHTTCMTGDGVNDVLAMKEAGCSVAMVGGSAAARGASDFILMSSDFSAMKDVLREGRKVINNIEQVASLYLVKTIYSTILSLMYSFLPYPFPYTPIQMTPINFLTVGIPSFFLALRNNYERPKGKLLINILENAFPAAMAVVLNILFFQMASFAFDLEKLELSTLCSMLVGVITFILLWNISKPRSKPVIILLAVLQGAFLLLLLFFGDIFSLGSLFGRSFFFYAPMIFISMQMFRVFNQLLHRMYRRYVRWRKDRNKYVL